MYSKVKACRYICYIQLRRLVCIIGMGLLAIGVLAKLYDHLICCESARIKHVSSQIVLSAMRGVVTTC